LPKKKDYSSYSKEELIKQIHALEKHKSYGLVWDVERSKEQFEKDVEGKFPVLKEVTSKEIKSTPTEPTHIIIEGDNYHALSVLNYTHNKSIDVIYIDPPYNTGNKDFLYNDSYVDHEDAFRHSKWLSFMSKRLSLAKPLLKTNALFFVSIDDNEIGQLKLLCDEIFMESNFRNSIVVARVKKNIKERTLVKSLNLGQGYLLFYGRSDTSLIEIPTKFQRKEERWHAFDAPGIRKTMEYKLFGHKPPNGRHWMYEEERAKKLITKGQLRKNPNSGKPQYRLEASNVTMLDTNWTDIQEGDSKYAFENGEKNVRFIKRLLAMHPSKNITVLDFFAGSGTTAEAVMELNNEHTGKRQCILITNNENGICDKVCYPRIKKIIKGYSGKSGLDGNLKYYQTSFVGSEPTHRNKKILTDQSTEMLCLKENAFDEIIHRKAYRIFKNSDKYLAILFDEILIEEFKKELRKLKLPIRVYAFSLEGDDFAEDFEDLENDITVCSIPEAILRVYRRIFKK
jgi:adenine-specific DNA-methyltransferase